LVEGGSFGAVLFFTTGAILAAIGNNQLGHGTSNRN
jgi:hypothetical protein